MKKYPKYKLINIPWLKEIPKHWELKMNKFIFYLNKDVVGENSNKYTLLSLTLNGIIKRDMENPKGKFPAEFNTYQIVSSGDLVFCLFDVEETPRTVGLSPYDGMITGAYTVTKCKINTVNKYIYYYYLFLDERKLLKCLYTGLRNTISKDTFLSLNSPLPPIQEQTQIANFLDYKHQQIDIAVKKKKRLIKILKEQKQAIIDKAVTKGLNPNVELKPSGMEWLGQIPEHWTVKKLKYVVNKVGSGVTPKGGAATYLSQGIPLLRSQNIYSDRFELKDVAFISNEIHDSMSNSKVRIGDVLLNITGGSLGRCFYVDDGFKFEEANVNQHVCIIRPSKKILSKYLHLLIICELGQRQIWKEQTGSGREGLNFEAIKKFLFPIPNLQEQESIIKFVDNENIKIERTISRIEQEITLLKEYKTALIVEAVTGKIDVREWQPKNNENNEKLLAHAQKNGHI